MFMLEYAKRTAARTRPLARGGFFPARVRAPPACSYERCASRASHVKRSAAQYAVLSPLLDEALGLDDGARAEWLAQLPEAYRQYRPALSRILLMDNANSMRHLNTLELRLRSCGRRVNVLVLAEFDRRK
jgi:hypothetical protein